MSYRMHPKQMSNVFGMSARDRFEHFLDKVADWEELWTLVAKDRTLLTAVAKTEEYLPVWPHPEYAKEYSKELPHDVAPERIPVDEFLDEWLPNLDNKGLKVGVFPDLQVTVWIIEPKDLFVQLKEALAQYKDE